MQSLWMLLAATAIASMSALVKSISGEYHALELVFYRGLVASILLGSFALFAGRHFRTSRPWGHFGRSSLGTVSMCLWFFALTQLPLGTAVTLNYTSPIFIAIIVAIGAWYKRSAASLRILFYMAVGLSFSGVLLILQPSLERDAQLGLASGLTSGAVSAVCYMLVRRLGRLGEAEWLIVFYFSLANAVLAGLASFVVGWHLPQLADLPVLFAVGSLAVIGQLSLTRAFSRGNTLVTANLHYTGVVIAALIGWLVFGEYISFLELLGMAMIILSGIIATWYSAHADRR